MRPRHELEDLGVYFGYPNCCIEYFVKNAGATVGWNNYAKTSWAWGTGYVPCPVCNKKDKGVLLNEINFHRRCAAPFKGK